jgi:CPA1 family monovalent cation:H+ antiporter
VLNELGIGMPLIYCLVFGALISPTDPIAVLGIIKELKAPKSLETIIAGESLFNDGMAVTMVTLLMGIAVGDANLGITGTLSLFLHEVVGGIAFGWALGWVGIRLIRSVDDYNTEVLITVAMALGGFSAAAALGVSGPIAITVTGIVFGNQGRMLAMSRTTRLYLDHFWEIVDDALNGILFVLIGLELVALASRGEYLAAIASVIPIALISRMISVVVPVGLLRGVRRFPPKLVETLTWGGLRGGVSIALALSLPKGPEREIILHMAYGIVVFSILVQGLTLRRFIRASDD